MFEGDKLSLLADRDLYIGARIGFAVSPNMLLYAKGGYTNARLKLRYSLDGDSASIGDNIDGYRIGGGAEFTNGSNFARLEYRYSDYGKYVYREGGIELDTGVKMSRHQIAVTGGFHF
ncbi:Opacity protein precursor [Sphingobium yanoikuyae]|uniref:Opacity protein n=1 Tax=Sphingobium yanoikuyae TaxID=13690 RepID=A0A084E2E7_SPHYA|nr:Opacity protein precursor [Sphingobium yanoikuyae]